MKTIKIPKGLSDDELVEFIHEEVRKVGGDPSTLYPIDYEDYNNKPGNHVVYPLLNNEPLIFSVSLEYKDNTAKDSPRLEIPLECAPDYPRLKDTIDKWTEMVTGTQNELATEK